MSEIEPWELEGSSSSKPTVYESSAATQSTHESIHTTWASSAGGHAPEPPTEADEDDLELKETMGSSKAGDARPPSPVSSALGTATVATPSRGQTEDISLWQTVKELYKRHPRTKYFILVLILLLSTSVILLGVSLSNRKSQQDCTLASYNSDPFIIQSPTTDNRGSGAFGASMDSSSTYLVIGDPNPSCIQTDCTSYTIGGAAYVYRQSNKKDRRWELYSQFILDDSISPGDEFGYSVSISEDSKTIVVGAPMDDGLGVTAGAVYVMEEPFNNNAPLLRLVPDDIGANDEFGGSVSVSITSLPAESNNNDRVKVTNIVAGSASDDDFGAESGGVYVFSKFEGIPVEGACGGQDIVVNEWIQCQKLLPDDGGTYDRFGKSVHIADRTIAVGTDWDDDMGIDAGAVYVYSLGDDGNWGLQQKLVPTNTDSTANKFGNAVATSGNVLVVGADLDDSQGADSGAAYVYTLSKGVWNLDSRLITIDENPVHDGYKCGTSVDISSDGQRIMVGCPNGGVAFVFVYQNAQVWVQQDYFRYQDFYSKETAKIGKSVTAQPGTGNDGIATNGLNGQALSYSKDC